MSFLYFAPCVDFDLTIARAAMLTPSYRWTVPLADNNVEKFPTPRTLPDCANTNFLNNGYADVAAAATALSASKFAMNVAVGIAAVTPEKNVGSIIADVPMTGIILLPLSWYISLSRATPAAPRASIMMTSGCALTMACASVWKDVALMLSLIHISEPTRQAEISY